MEVLIKNQQRLVKISKSKIERDSGKALLLLGLEEVELSIFLVNDKKMRELNSAYRGKNKPTDVLSFPQYSWRAGKRRSGKTKNFRSSNLLLGDIVINLQAAKRQALEHCLSFHEELRWLTVHGILHLIGYDHEKSISGNRKMREKERELLSELD